MQHNCYASAFHCSSVPSSAAGTAAEAERSALAVAETPGQSVSPVRNYGSLDSNMAAPAGEGARTLGGVAVNSGPQTADVSGVGGCGDDAKRSNSDTSQQLQHAVSLESNSTRSKPSLMKALPDVVKSCEDLSSEEKDTQTDNLPPGMPPGPGPVVAVVDPTTAAGSLQQVGTLNPRGPPAPPRELPLVSLSPQDYSLYSNEVDDDPIAIISGTLPADRSPGDGTDGDLGDGSKDLAYKEGRTPADTKAAVLLSSNDQGADNMGYDSIHLDVVNSNGKLQDSVSIPGSDLDFECDIPGSPGRDPESPEKETEQESPKKFTSWRQITTSQRFILAALMLGNIFSAVFYSLLAPFFPTEVSHSFIHRFIYNLPSPNIPVLRVKRTSQPLS